MAAQGSAATRPIEFFSAANLDDLPPPQAGPAVQTLDVRFADGAEGDVLRDGSALFSQYMKSFASDFDDIGLHIGVIEFAPGLIAPLHSHSDDCVYYVERGSIILGSRTLGPGEGFVTHKDQPYGFVVGPEGLRLIEFTTEPRRDITFHERRAHAWRGRLEQAVAKLRPAAGGWVATA
jgi:hypothetical protein